MQTELVMSVLFCQQFDSLQPLYWFAPNLERWFLVNVDPDELTLSQNTNPLVTSGTDSIIPCSRLRFLPSFLFFAYKVPFSYGPIHKKTHSVPQSLMRSQIFYNKWRHLGSVWRCWSQRKNHTFVWFRSVRCITMLHVRCIGSEHAGEGTNGRKWRAHHAFLIYICEKRYNQQLWRI